ncbi:hypothetical protein [Streptomyces ochraceiscleroticus]|uniref:Uncharacterized protein n=1 Tax=Streptomyces ochraceiscleroticus TaxID=47761 RepID=A0ABW1MJE4_9ACTN|nr:hypothetical protein [Streptomyces ochraceiscleroticus]
MSTDALPSLTTDDTGSATGQLLTAASFTLPRSQRQPWKTLGRPRLVDFHVRIDHDGQHIGVPPP